MATKIYGASDDLIEVEGDVHGEGSGDEEPRLVVCSDGTVLEVKYGKGAGDLGGVWGVAVIRKGDLFQRIDLCDDPDADPYSDVAHFGDGLRWAFIATEYSQI